MALITHISGHPSAAGRAQDRESSPARDRRSGTVPRHQLVIKGANLCLKCTEIRLAARLRPDLLWELMRSPRSPSRNEDLLLTGGTVRGEGRKPSSKGDGREGNEERGDGN